MKSLRDQLTLRLLIGGGLLLGAAGAACYWQVNRALTMEFDQALIATAQSFSAMTEQKHDHVELDFEGASMPDFEYEKGSSIFLLRYASGREIERSRSLGSAAITDTNTSRSSIAFFDFMAPDGRRFRCAKLSYAPHVDDDKTSNRERKSEVVLVIGKDRVPLDRTMNMLRVSLLLVGAVTLALLVVIVRWSVHSSLRPLDLLGQNVAMVDANSLSIRFPLDHLPAELRPVVIRLNKLLARLESAFDRERRFTAAAAHELRTPLAELRTLAEVNLSTPTTLAEHATSWADALATTRRMESLALRLLELSRAENSAHIVQREAVFVSEAIESAWQPWAEHAARRGISFEVDIPRSISVSTDRSIFGVIAGNLCANASQHAAANSTLHVSAVTTPDYVALKFRSLASDLAEVDMPRLFERFWRKDTSRADPSRHGFGLSLASEFARLLGATLTAQLHVDGCVEFSLQLPHGV